MMDDSGLDAQLAARGFDCADGEPSTLVSVTSQASTLVVLFDGGSSWGSGVEAAAWCRDHLAERVTDLDAMSSEALAACMLALAADVPQALRDPQMGWSFSGVALLLRAAGLTVAASGLFSVSLWGTGGVTTLFTPLMLVDHLIAEGKLTPEQVPDFPHRGIVMGPFLGDEPSAERPVVTSTEAQLGPEDVVLLAHRDVLDKLTAVDCDWRSAGAHELQRIAGAGQHGLRRSAVVLLRRSAIVLLRG